MINDYDKINHCTQKYVIKQRPFLFIGQVTSEYFLITCERCQKTLKVNKNQNAVMMDDKIKLTIIIYEMRYTIWTKHNLYSGSSCLKAAPG